MLQVDDVRLYDLPEAGALLFKDPARLRREIRLARVPAAWLPEGPALPAPWVDAEAGRSEADPDSLREYWLHRLAPPSPGARRAQRDRAALPAEDLLEAGEAATRLCATPRALERLAREGRLPALRVDGALCYDAVLVDLLAAEDEGRTAEGEARRALVRAWARHEYVTPVTPPAAAGDPAATDVAAPVEPAAEVPGAWRMPEDVARLMDVEGFETVDED